MSFRKSTAVVAAFLAVASISGYIGAAQAATSPLTRAPYLTDATSSQVRVNWATASNAGSNILTWGAVGSGCNQFSSVPSPTYFGVKGLAEATWTAVANSLQPGVSYCYQVTVNGVPTLASPPTFRALPAPGSGTEFSFDVFGDTGYNGSGSNPNQDAIYRLMASSGANFALTTGDIAYPGGTQDNYGDLIHTGLNVSNVFGPTGWPVAGARTPLFPVLGNHGRIKAFLDNWPAATNVAASSGKFAMVSYPGQSGALTRTYPTAYYAFSVGRARFYVLDADWSDSNVGTTNVYQQDAAQHWSATSAQLKWLKADLATHPGGLKFAQLHFPLHSDSATEASDTFLQGASALEGLLAINGVKIAFTGHAHIYQRNVPVLGMISYVTGGGGARLTPIAGRGCATTDAYGIGWGNTSQHGSRCGSAPVPTSAAKVYHYLHVSVGGSTVTVAPTNSLGQTFDVQTYTF